MDMTDLQRAIDTLVEVWEKFTASIKEMADALNKEFRHLRKRRKRV